MRQRAALAGFSGFLLVFPSAAVDVAAANQAGGLPSTFLDGERDVRLGQLVWNEETQSWKKQWGVSPYNVVEVTVRRDQAGSANGNRPLDLSFARIIGHDQAITIVVSTSAMLPGSGLRTQPGENVMVLPFVLDEKTWDGLIEEGEGEDKFSYNPETGEVTEGGWSGHLSASALRSQQIGSSGPTF